MAQLSISLFSVHTKPVLPIMKQYRFPLLIVFVAMLATQTLRAQSNCYVQLEDASGYTPTSEQIEVLEQAAAELCLAFDSSGFGGQFKVYDFGFYLHHEATEGGYPEPFARKVEEVAALSPYYLVFGKQSDRSGVYTRYWVEARLPDSLSFSCLDTIGAGILRTSLGLTANIEYEALGKMPYNFHLAEIRVMNKLKAEVDKLRECCYNQQRGLSSCDAPCLSPEETEKLLEQLGFTAIPIKILGPAQARGTDGQRPIYDRVTDCAGLDIEMDGVEYHDFAGTINNIMSVYPDSTARAEILDGGCLCEGGLEYLKNLMGTKAIILIIHIDTVYTYTQKLDVLGVLPFKGHLKNDIGYQEIIAPLNLNTIKGIINDIYQKNGFTLAEIDFQKPANLDTFDLFNRIIIKTDSDNIGKSWVHILTSDELNYINYKKAVLDHIALMSNNQDLRNYVIGVATAHEFFHQILSKCRTYIQKSCKFILQKDLYEGHCIDDRNLMFPGNGLSDNEIQKSSKSISWSNEEIAQLKKEGNASISLYLSGVFFPNKNLPALSPWERIPPTYKYILSIALLVYNIQNEYGNLSKEFLCTRRILIESDLVNIKYNSYEISK